MFKAKYERTKMELIRFQCEDVILTSVLGDEYEGWNPHTPGNSSSEYEGWNPH